MLITNNHDLEQYCNQAASESLIAFDTEFMRNKTYFPKLSLVQIATSKRVFAVDVLAGLDYTPLKALLNNNNILKIIHSARQDLETLYTAFGFIPKNLFDTQTAVLFLGYKDSPSFETLTADFLDIKISKQLQFSDWLARPLAPAQIEYALADAQLLYQLFSPIKLKLEALERFEWAYQESNLITTCDRFFPTPLELLAKFLHPLHHIHDLTLAYKLVKFRETHAQQKDLPRGHFLKDEAILYLCHKRPKTYEDLDKAKFHLRSLDVEEKLALLEIILTEHDEEEINLVTEFLNTKKSQINYKTQLFHMLKILLEVTAKRLGIHEPLIASSSDLIALSTDNPSKINSGWREQSYGTLATQLKEGKITLGYKNGDFFIL